jgi:hypothetical protein
MKKLLFLFIFFSCQFTFADDGDWWLQRQIEIEQNQNAYAKKVYGKSARMIREEVPIPNSPKTEVRDLIKRSIAVDVPTASKVGTPMLSRVQALVRSPGGAFIGALAVSELLEAIGWVMEDGTYVKKIPDENDPNYEFYWIVGGYSASKSPSSSTSAQLFATSYCNTYGYGACKGVVSEVVSLTRVQVKVTKQSGSSVGTFYGTRYSNPNYDPTKDPQYKTFPITPSLLGAAMLGAGYSDPAGDISAEATVNDGDYTGVKEIYEHDPSGTGNEVAEDMDDKLKNAPQTDDGQPSYAGDPKYDSGDLAADSDTSDRSWTEDGGTATGDSNQETDLEGNPTGYTSISLKFPLFCTWASQMCKWYDDWKASDQVYKDHMTKTEEHQKDEKTFWEWFKSDDVPNNEEDSKVEDDKQLPQISTDTFNFGGMCPTDINLPIPDPFGHTNNLTLSFQTFCLWLTKLNPWIDVLGWIIAISILTGQRSANNEQ